MTSTLDANLIGANMRGNRVKHVGKPAYPQDAMTFGIPTYTTDQRDSLPSITDGLLIYNSTLNKLQARINGAWESLAVE